MFGQIASFLIDTVVTFFVFVLLLLPLVLRETRLSSPLPGVAGARR